MALVIYWFDFIVFAIVDIAIYISLSVLLRKEGRGECNDDTNNMNKSLLDHKCDGYVSSSQLWTSCWAGIMKPWWLLVLRLFCAVLMIVILVCDVWFFKITVLRFYTEWTFTLVTVYFVLGTIISAHGCWVHSKEIGTSASEILELHNDQKAGFWGYLMQVLYQTCAGAVTLTDFTFWCILLPFTKVKLNPVMVLTHSVNAVVLLLDTAVNNLPFPWFRMGYFVLWSCTYLIFQWFIHACGVTEWPYPFLDLSTPAAPAWYFVFALIHIPCYVLFDQIIKWKNQATR